MSGRNPVHCRTRNRMPSRNRLDYSRTSRGTIHCITIVGQIEGHMELPHQNKPPSTSISSRRLRQLNRPTKSTVCWFCSTRSAAMWRPDLPSLELIAGMKADRVARASAAGIRSVYRWPLPPKGSFIAISAAMTIHPVRMNGTIIAVPQAFRYLARNQERIVDFITSHTSLPNVCSSLCAKPVS